MAEWFFRKKSKGEVERDPGWDEYFTSNRSTDESLVREAIQNSLKGEGTRGKWGIGKVVFPIASRLRSFFAYSIRNEEPRELLCGKALLSYHTVSGQRYSADDDGLDLIRQWIVAAVQAFVRGKGLTKIANSWRDE